MYFICVQIRSKISGVSTSGGRAGLSELVVAGLVGTRSGRVETFSIKVLSSA